MFQNRIHDSKTVHDFLGWAFQHNGSFLANCEGQGILKSEIVTGKDGKRHFKFNSFNLALRIGDYSVHLDNLFNGDPILSTSYFNTKKWSHFHKLLYFRPGCQWRTKWEQKGIHWSRTSVCAEEDFRNPAGDRWKNHWKFGLWRGVSGKISLFLFDL